jgi:transcriptional regulator with PAS, ATPase and Fis domain
VRIVAATHRDLPALVQRGEFRQDLYYRLHVIPIALPALRDRSGDLKLLVDHFLAQLGQSGDGSAVAPARVSTSAWRCLERYAWPGNVRELRAEIERWAITAAGESEVGPEHLSPALREAGGYSGHSGGEAATAAAAGEGSLQAAIDALERAILARGLERTAGNRTRLAKELQISRTTLNERIKKFGLGE